MYSENNECSSIFYNAYNKIDGFLGINSKVAIECA